MPKKSFIKQLIIFFIFCLLIGEARSFNLARAISVDELKEAISDRQTLIKKLDEEIKQYENKIDATRQQGASLKKEIQQIDLTRQQLQTNLTSTQNKIIVVDTNIKSLDKNIQTTEEKINTDKNVIAEALREINKQENINLAETIINSNRFTDLWANLSRIQSLNNKLNDHLTSLRGNKQILEVNKNQKEQEKSKLSGLKENLSDQKKAVDITKQVKDNLLTETKNQESTYQKLLADRKKKKQDVEAEIAKAEAELRYALDPSKLPSTGSGVIAWPLTKRVITQYFGNTDFAQKHQSVYNGKGHNGIDLAANIGTAVYAAENGEVVGTGDTDITCRGASLGKWILIRHDNGLSTLYAHLSSIKVSANQRVKRGESIALSGNTGYSTGPHLHFGLYASDGVKISSLKSKVAGCGTYTLPIASYSAYLNPLNYL